MTEPINSVLLVLAGALLGATAANCWACWVERWRWRRTWRRLADRQAVEWPAASHAARFLAQSAELRTQARARELARLAKVHP